MVLSSTNRELRDSQLVDNRWRNVWIDAQVYDSNMLSLEHAIDTTEASSEDEKDEGDDNDNGAGERVWPAEAATAAPAVVKAALSD